MRIESLSKKNIKVTTTRTKFVGGFMPPALSAKLNLYCLTHRINKTVVLKEALANLLSTVNSVELEAELIRHLNSEWKIRAEEEKRTNFSNFKAAVAHQLEKQEIERKSIDNILEGLKE